jgi:UTP--glucose-1-phosphate uridylyltransferase
MSAEGGVRQETQGNEMNKPVRKAVLPVAGLGTRFLPATKAVPKEMLTIVDRPVLQHVVDEAREAGIEHFVFVTGRNKAVIEDHFDMAYELEDTLTRRGKQREYEALMADLPAAGATSFTRQQAPLGLGHAVWCAREIIGDEPFAVLLPDMITMAGSARSRCLAQCLEAYGKHGGNIIAVEEVPPEETHQYGIVAVGADHGASFEITGMVEKPKQGTAPSNLIISGRYILQPEIFGILERVEKGAGGEIQLTDGMVALAKKQAFHGVRFDGRTYDCGSKLGFLTANIAFALARPDLAPALRAEIHKLEAGR